MSNFGKVQKSVERWLGRLDGDAGAHVTKPTRVTLVMHPGAKATEVNVEHVDGSDDDAQNEDRGQYGTPAHPEGVTPFGESGLQGREWAGDKPQGSAQPSADLTAVRESEREPGDAVAGGDGRPDGINAGVVSDGGNTATGSAPVATPAPAE
jgi:hypothetical protein